MIASAERSPQNADDDQSDGEAADSQHDGFDNGIKEDPDHGEGECPLGQSAARAPISPLVVATHNTAAMASSSSHAMA